MKIKMEKKEPEFNTKDLHFEFDLAKTDYQIDALQNELLMTYLRADPRFRRAFSRNYTNIFLKFLQDKARLKEPVHISTIGQVRCLLKGSKILMANGEWENIENVKIGDEILSPQKEGKNIFSKIVGISQYISKENYGLYEKNTNKKLYECSANHIIPTFFRGSLRIDKKNPNSKRISNWYYGKKTAKEMFNRKNKDYLLISSFPILKFKNRKNCKIDPYVLGFYLGDGHYTTSLGITTQDIKIIEKISKVYKYMNVNYKKGGNAKTYLFSKNSKFSKLLQKYNLRFMRSKNKFIPKEALLSNINYRRKLLAGLIDSDGTLSKDCAYSITSKSKQLADDILFLIKSIGGYGHICKISKMIKSINFKGNYFRISFYLGKEIKKIPIIKHNKIRINNRPYWKNSPNRISFKLKKIKSKLVYGIEIDSPSKWFITDNFIITHNSGKSYSMISLASFLMACYGKKFTIEYICANAFEFLEKLRTMPQEKLSNSCFLIDEEKQTIFGVGSMAKKMKLTDVQNIIAINNISTIMLNPHSWANKEALYGLRIFGRCFNTKTCRMMLYNLQEKGKGGELPMGCIYLPIFTTFLPKDYAEELEKQYMEKKMNWVRGEMRGEGDVLYEIKKKSAESFIRDKKYLEIIKMNEKLAYISFKLGSEWTKGECNEIFQLTKLLQQGILDTEN